MQFIDEATLNTPRTAARRESRWKLPLAFLAIAILLLASIRGVAQTLLNPVALRTTFDDLNLIEEAGVARNELDQLFDDMTVGTGNTLRVLDGETLALGGAVTLIGNFVGTSPPLAMDDGSGA